MRKWLCLSLCIAFLCGCTQQGEYKLKEQKLSSIQIEDDAYFMPGQTIQTISKSTYEKADVVYYAKSELELAKIILYQLEQSVDTISYQSDKKLDLNKVSEYLSLLNPFDLSLTQNVETFTDTQDKVLYESYQLQIENLDPRYQQSVSYVKSEIQNIINETMTMNEKITAIHDYIAKQSVYDKYAGSKTSVFQAGGVFFDRLAVCTGYSRAFMMLAKEAGIPTVYVPSESMNHSWNYVYDGDVWRYVDVTWDDIEHHDKEILSNRFLSMSEADFIKEGSHTLSEEEQAIVHELSQAMFSQK